MRRTRVGGDDLADRFFKLGELFTAAGVGVTVADYLRRSKRRTERFFEAEKPRYERVRQALDDNDDLNRRERDAMMRALHAQSLRDRGRVFPIEETPE